MTVSSEQSFIEYIGDGTTKTFTIPFYFLLGSDISITITDSTGSAFELAYGINFSVVGDGSPSGGAATLNTAPALGSVVNISRDPPVTQETAYQENGKFPAKSHEKALDKLTMIIQSIIHRLNVSNSKAVKVPESGNWIAPKIADRNNRLFAWDNDGKPIAVLPQSGSASDVLVQLASSADGKGDALMAVKSPFSNSVPRTQHDKNLEIISVKDFGAVGDGVADDTAAITAAITVGQNTNWMVYFPPGDYVISSVINVNLDVKTQLVLMGAGEHVTKIKVAGASQNFLAVTGNFGNYWLDSVTPNGSFTMSNMTVSCWGGVDNSGTAISMNMGSQLGRPNKGIRFTNVSFKSEVGFFAYNVSLRNCAQINFDTCRFFSGNGVQSGIGILGQCDSGQDGGGMFINNCEFFYFLHGIYTMDRFEGIYVTSSAFINCKYGFTSVVGSESGVLITNSEFDCMFEGIHLEGMYDFVITGNCFLSPDADGQIAISVKNCSGFTITGNKIEGISPTTGTGILLENTDDILTRASYVGSNSIANCNIAMQITNCSNITFGPWAWKSCTLDTNAGGTNTYIQQGCYEKNTTIVKTLSGSTATWTITIDISDMRLTRTPKFANLVSQSTPNMIAQYNYAASSNTSVVFIVTLGNGATISANPYRFGLSVRQPFFDF